MSRRPDTIPDGLEILKKRDYQNWLLQIISVVLVGIAIGILSPETIIRLINGTVSPTSLIFSPSAEYYAFLAIPVFPALIEIHEQCHRIAAVGLGLEPTYRRWYPFNSGGYVLIQETWISRRERTVMTASPILFIQLPSLLVLLVISGTLGAIAEIAFVLNAGMIAKDVADIILNFRLPKEAQFWMSDLDGEPIEYISAPD